MGLFTKNNTNENVYLQATDYRYDNKCRSIMTNAAAASDAAHILAHGLTFGSMLHMATRAGNWSELSRSVYSAASANPKLAAYKAVNGSQVLIAGYNYITVYQSGEYQKKVINYSDIVRISGTEGYTTITMRTDRPNVYAFVRINTVAEGNINMVNRIIGFIEKNNKRNTRAWA